MKTPENSKRSRMIGTRYTPEQIAIITRIAKDHNITVSDLIYLLTTNTMHLYPHIGKDSPNEERLKKEIENLLKEIRKKTVELEDANTKIGIDKKRIVELEKDCLKYIVELEQLLNENKKKDQEIIALNEQMNELKKAKNQEITSLKKRLNELANEKSSEIELLKKQLNELKHGKNENDNNTYQIPNIGSDIFSVFCGLGNFILYGGRKS